MRAQEKYNSKPKDERRKEAPEALETKRFKISSNPELRERLRNLRKVIEKVQTNHPEVISVGLFGSMVKGYATEESDIDIYVNIDTDVWKRTVGEDKEYYQIPNLHKIYKTILQRELKDQLGLSDEQINDITVNFMNKSEIRDASSKGQASHVWRIFLMSVGSNMADYRREVFDGIDYYARNNPEFGNPNEEELTEIRNYEWRKLIENLFELENSGLKDSLVEKRKKLYPWTYDAGKNYFLGNDS